MQHLRSVPLANDSRIELEEPVDSTNGWCQPLRLMNREPGATTPVVGSRERCADNSVIFKIAFGFAASSLMTVTPLGESAQASEITTRRLMAEMGLRCLRAPIT